MLEPQSVEEKPVEVEFIEDPPEKDSASDEDVKDAWDADSSDEDEESEAITAAGKFTFHPT